MTCKCYHADKNFIGGIGVCWGTKECEPCSCNGDESKCDFYDYVRNRAKKTINNIDRKDEYMDAYLYYDNEINYIAKQIKILFNLHAVFVEFSLKNLCYKLTFVGHPLFTFRVKIMLLEELREKSYSLIIKDICDFLIDEMEL